MRLLRWHPTSACLKIRICTGRGVKRHTSSAMIVLASRHRVWMSVYRRTNCVVYQRRDPTLFGGHTLRTIKLTVYCLLIIFWFSTITLRLLSPGLSRTRPYTTLSYQSLLATRTWLTCELTRPVSLRQQIHTQTQHKTSCKMPEHQPVWVWICCRCGKQNNWTVDYGCVHGYCDHIRGDHCKVFDARSKTG